MYNFFNFYFKFKLKIKRRFQYTYFNLLNQVKKQNAKIQKLISVGTIQK